MSISFQLGANLPIISKDEVWHAVCYFILRIQAMKKE
jgi:hypothetical protein